MSEPIKLDASEVEFWKECVVAGLRHDAEPIAYQATCEPPGLWAVALSDAAVVALRERVKQPTVMEKLRDWHGDSTGCPPPHP